MTDTTQSANAEMLLAMADQEFEKIVISQLNTTRRTPEIYELLLSPDIVLRTKEILDILRLRTQNTMQAKRAELYEFQARCAEEGWSGRSKWLRGKGEYETDRHKSGHFLKLVEIMQLQVKRPARAAASRPETSKKYKNGKNRQSIIQTLVGALIAHERVQQEHCTSQDEVLWDLLDTLTISWNEQDHTLREMHEAGWE